MSVRYYEVEFRVVVQSKSPFDAIRAAEIAVNDGDWDQESDITVLKASLAPETVESAKKRGKAAV